jgi:copper chaperone CopZ
VRAITTEVSAVAHVAKVTVDIPSKLVTIDHENVPAPALVSAINEAGFDTVEAVAETAVIMGGRQMPTTPVGFIWMMVDYARGLTIMPTTTTPSTPQIVES